MIITMIMASITMNDDSDDDDDDDDDVKLNY